MQKKRSSNFGLIIFILVFICFLLVICAGLYFWYTGAFSPSAVQPQAPQPTESVLIQPAPQAVSGVTGAGPVLYLAGRTDIIIPPLGETSEISIFSCRDGSIVQETFPPGYRITPGAEFHFTASGMINYYGGELQYGYPPDGEPNGNLAFIESFGGISAYEGPAGALAGVFLTDAIPLEPAPEKIRFTPDALGVEFARLEPQVGQVFFIGDGRNGSGAQQAFIAPANATRLFVGLVDGASFYGIPTCYADNLGSYDFQVASSQPFQPLP